MTEPHSNRAFAVTAAGETSELTSPEARVQHMGVSPALSAAYDILDDAGVVTDDRLKVLAATERNGDDPEAMARKLVKLIRR